MVSIGSTSQRTPWVYGHKNEDYVRVHFETTEGGAADGRAQTADLTPGPWHHVAFTWNGTTVTPYLNGVAGTTDTTIGSILANADGSLKLGIIPGYAHFDGKIDEVRIWNEALTAKQIALSAKGSVDWLPPVTNADFLLKDGTTLPLKFQIFENGTLVNSQQPVFLEVTGPSDFAITYQLGEGVENLRWNADESYYIANLKTKDGTWPAGEYTATVHGIVTRSITFYLSAEKGVGRGNSGK